MKTLTLLELAATPYASHESFSPFCLKIHRALKLAGLPYERRHASRPDAHKAFNSTGQVPVLLVDGEPLADSTRILHFIDEQRPFAKHPEAWLWEEFADNVLNGFLVAARWADPNNWPKTRVAYFGKLPIIPGLVRRGVMRMLHARDITRRDDTWRRFAEILLQLEARAPERFWLGETLTVADVAIFAQLHSLRTPLTQSQWDALSLCPRLTAYIDRVDALSRNHAARVTLAA